MGKIINSVVARGFNALREAANYVCEAMESTKLKAYYIQKARQLKLLMQYAAALTGFLRKAKATAKTNTTFAGNKGEVVQISVTKTVFKINTITAMLSNKDGEVLSEQILTKPATSNLFTFKCTADFSDNAFRRMITDESEETTDVIEAAEFLKAPLKRFVVSGFFPGTR